MRLGPIPMKPLARHVISRVAWPGGSDEDGLGVVHTRIYVTLPCKIRHEQKKTIVFKKVYRITFFPQEIKGKAVRNRSQ